MTGRELHEALALAGVYDVEPMPAYEALEYRKRDALDRAAALLDVYPAIEAIVAAGGKLDPAKIRAAIDAATSGRTYPASGMNPLGPPTVSGTDVTKDVGQ